MVKHIVFWKIKAGLDKPATCNEIKTKLAALRGQIPGLISIEAGIDISQSPVAYDIALYSELTDESALTAYQAHPLHETVKAYISSVTSDRCVVDYIQ
jgi:hypothetical protein